MTRLGQPNSPRAIPSTSRDEHPTARATQTPPPASRALPGVRHDANGLVWNPVTRRGGRRVQLVLVSRRPCPSSSLNVGIALPGAGRRWEAPAGSDSTNGRLRPSFACSGRRCEHLACGASGGRATLRGSILRAHRGLLVPIEHGSFSDVSLAAGPASPPQPARSAPCAHGRPPPRAHETARAPRTPKPTGQPPCLAALQASQTDSSSAADASHPVTTGRTSPRTRPGIPSPPARRSTRRRDERALPSRAASTRGAVQSVRGARPPRRLAVGRAGPRRS
jgi:hypothetical protein